MEWINKSIIRFWMATDQPSSRLVGKNGAITGPVTSSSRSNFTWKTHKIEIACSNFTKKRFKWLTYFSAFQIHLNHKKYLNIDRLATLQAFLLKNLVGQLNVGVPVAKPRIVKLISKTIRRGLVTWQRRPSGSRSCWAACSSPRPPAPWCQTHSPHPAGQ